jgi:putative nucleotidyltransferase with HDIG domain
MSREEISVAQLQAGLFIELPLKWHEHPFLTGKFLLKDEAQIAVIRQLRLRNVWYFPDRSKVLPLPEEADASELPVDNEQAELDQAWIEKRELARQLTQRRQEIQKVEKQYNQTVHQVKSLMIRMNSLPAQAISEAGELVDKIVQALLSDKDTVIHLMNSNSLDDTLYYHVLNVSVLSLMLAREAGLPEKLFSTLGFAALMHDIGQIKIPPQILRKTSSMTKSEQDFYEQHVHYGVEMIKKFGHESRLVWDVIDQHHEFCDGSGYPNHLKSPAIRELAKIVCIVNHYDKLCNHNDPRQSMTPHEAMSLMFAKQGPKFEKKYLQLFVKLLGIYPPGTVVQLSDERIGMVISLNRAELLKPSILIYDPEVPKEQAVIVDLADNDELSIRRSLKPIQLRPEVFIYLNPRERVSYFFKMNAPKAAGGD